MAIHEASRILQRLTEELVNVLIFKCGTFFVCLFVCLGLGYEVLFVGLFVCLIFLFLKLTRYEWLIFHCSAYCNGECFKKKKKSVIC